jgi:uncharacterized membrane protein YccC
MTDSRDNHPLLESLREHRANQAEILDDYSRQLEGYQSEIARLREIHAKSAQRDWSAAERVWARFERQDRIRNLFDIACALLCLAVIWRAFACW